ncbi:MAG: hypothetical protein Q7S75_00555 [bacterium]|nr:hypothetical protein [bacterium]
MTKNPFFNAILASGYIVLVASAIYYSPKSMDHVDAAIVPIVFLSVFVLSAAVMGTLFFYQPVHMYLDGTKKEAVSLFFKTLGTFAIITALLVSVLVVLSQGLY